MSQLFFVLNLVQNAVLVHKQIYDPSFSLPQQYPIAYVVLSIAQTVLYVFFALHVLVCVAWYIVGVSSKIIRHTSFILLTIIFLLVLTASKPF